MGNPQNNENVIWCRILMVGLFLSCSHLVLCAEGSPYIDDQLIFQDTIQPSPAKAVQQDKKKSDTPIDHKASVNGKEAVETVVKAVPKAKNRMVPKPVQSPKVNIKVPPVKPVKVKVNTKVKIKL